MGALPSAVIFDCDGVVVDTERMHYDAIQEALQPAGIEFGWERYEAEYRGCDDSHLPNIYFCSEKSGRTFGL